MLINPGSLPADLLALAREHGIDLNALELTDGDLELVNGGAKGDPPGSGVGGPRVGGGTALTGNTNRRRGR